MKSPASEMRSGFFVILKTDNTNIILVPKESSHAPTSPLNREIKKRQPFDWRFKFFLKNNLNRSDQVLLLPSLVYLSSEQSVFHL